MDVRLSREQEALRVSAAQVVAKFGPKPAKPSSFIKIRGVTLLSLFLLIISRIKTGYCPSLQLPAP